MTTPEDEEEEQRTYVKDGVFYLGPPKEPQSGEQLRAFALISLRRPWWRRVWIWFKRKLRG